MRARLPIVLLAIVTVLPAAARSRRDPVVLDLGEDARAVWDPCPVWGELRIQVWRADLDLIRQVETLRHDAVESARAEIRDDGSTVVVLILDDEVARSATSLSRDGRLQVELPRLEGGERIEALGEMLASAVGSTVGHPAESMGYLPLGEASPWSFVSRPLVPAQNTTFLPTVHLDSEAAADPDSSTSLVLTPSLAQGLEARGKANSGEDPAWWDECGARFQLVASRMEDDHTHESTLALAGECLYLAAAYDEASFYFDRAARQFSYTPRAGWHLLGRGMAQQGMGRLDQAIDDLEQAGARLPAETRGNALAALATTFASMERMREANATVEILRRGWPDTPFDPWLEAELAYRAAEPKQAAKLLVRLIDQDRERQHLVLVRLVDCAMMRDDEADVRYWLGELKADATGRADLMERLRRLEWDLLTGGGELEFPDAIAHLRAVSQVDPTTSLEIALAEAAFLHHNGMLLDGCRLDKETLRFHGDFMGRLQVESRMCSAAAELMEMAREQDNRVLAAGMYLEFVDRRDAATCTDPDLLWEVAADLQSLQLAEEARRALTSMLADERITPARREEVLLHLADLYLGLDRIDAGLETIEYYRKTATSSDRALDADVLEARLLLDAGRLDEAGQRVASVLKHKTLPAGAEARAERIAGQVALRQERWADAAGALGRARAAGTDAAAEDQLLEGWALYRAGSIAQADDLLASMDLDLLTPASREAALFLRAKVMREQGQLDEAHALLADPALVGERAFWSGLASEEAAEMLWYRRMGKLIGVPSAFDGDATGASTPSEH